MTYDQVMARLRKGDHLHMQFTAGKRVWWFESPHQIVADRTAIMLLTTEGSPIVEAGDSLFGFAMNSQTFVTQQVAAP